MQDRERLRRGLYALSLPDDAVYLEQWEAYYAMLVEKNKVMNLTAITEYDEVVTKHLLDSLCLVRAKKSCANVTDALRGAPKVLDLGTGAGFPGIPLKIWFPEWEFVLMDSLQKRIGFLQDVIRELGLKRVTAVHARAEEAARTELYRERFDLCVSRAVARLSSLSEFCLPFVKRNGFFMPYKAGHVGEELTEATEAITTLGGAATQILEYTLPDTDIQRTLVVIEKQRATDKRYPRGGGKPLKQPLGKKEKCFT